MSTKRIIISLVVLAVAVAAVCFAVFGGKTEFKKIESIEDLSGKNIAVLTGTIMDTVAEKYIDSPVILYGESESDNAVMLDTGKASAYVTDEPISRMIQKKYTYFRILAKVSTDEYGFIFKKDSAEATALCEKINEYLAKIKADGTLAEIDAIWFGDDEDLKTVDYPEEGVNGIISYGTSSAVGAPFSYVKDGKIVGYEVDIMARFCREYGYGLEITDYNFSGLLAAVQSGKDVDIGGGCITITEERAEKMLFSDADYNGGVVIMVSDRDPSADTKTFSEYISGIGESFYATFIKESRWKLFAEGIGNTMIITVLSVIFGTLLGFLVFWYSRQSGKIFKAVVSVFSKLIDGMPVVVLLMIFYYIIFGSSSLSAVGVATVCFAIVFASSVFGMLKASADTVSGAQTEAALALGFTDTETFFKVILPQALRHFLPLFKSSVITLIKSTAIVGYISVQDLTKMSDVVRSRTYDAFFPLIASAIIYFILEYIIIAVVKSIQISTDTKRRSADKILKGVTRR